MTEHEKEAVRALAREMSRRRFLKVAGVTGVSLAALAGFGAQCGGGAAPTATTAPAAEPTTAPTTAPAGAPTATTMAAADKLTGGLNNKPMDIKKVAFALAGAANDQGWNQPGYEAMVAAQKEFGFETTFAENVYDNPGAWVETFTGYATNGCQYIDGQGAGFEDAVVEVAAKYPENWFCTMSGRKANGINYVNYDVYWEQHGFLGGVAAAQLTKSGKIGVVIGMELPSMLDLAAGFKQGVAYVDPSYDVSVTFNGTFTDLVKGKQAALAQASAGADVWFHALDQGWMGLVEAAREKKGQVIGFWTDQYTAAPDVVATSIEQSWKAITVHGIRMAIEGTLEAKRYRYGLTDVLEGQPIGVYGKWNPSVSQDIIAKCDEARKKVVAGEITVTPDPNSDPT
jgi:basic membrane protein A and related proteins